MRKRDWETEAQIYFRLLTGQTQTQIARYLSKKKGMSLSSAKSIISRKVKQMIKNKILAIETRSNITVYTKSVNSTHFENIIKDFGIASIPGVIRQEEHNPPVTKHIGNSKIPPLDYFSGDALRIHNLQYKAELHGNLSGIQDLPSLYHLKWRETGETRGGTRHFWAELYLKDFEDWAKLHITKTKGGTLSLQIFLPAHYVPSEVIEGDYEQYYYSRAHEIARILTKSGFSFTNLQQTGHTHIAFRAPILDKYELHGKIPVGERVIADQSPGPQKSEIEAENKEGIPELITIQQIVKSLPDIIEAMKTIPELKREVQELKSALTYQNTPPEPGGMYQ